VILSNGSEGAAALEVDKLDFAENAHRHVLENRSPRTGGPPCCSRSRGCFCTRSTSPWIAIRASFAYTAAGVILVALASVGSVAASRNVLGMFR
jgi:hypothetical protein